MDYKTGDRREIVGLGINFEDVIVNIFEYNENRRWILIGQRDATETERDVFWIES